MLVSLDINEVHGSNPMEINWINLYKLSIDYDFEIIQKIINFTKNITKIYYFLEYSEVIDIPKFYDINKKLFTYLDKNNIPYKFVDNQSHNTMIGDITRQYMVVPESINDILNKKSIEKKFICLNGYPKNHRYWIYNFLVNSKISNDTFLSYNSSDSSLENHLTIEGDVYNDYDNNIKINPFYYKSFCNIVTETDFSDSMIHITEKTDKSIYILQPFIIVGNPHSLKKLKELGFKTFDKWWDESYDNCKNRYERMNMIKKTIRYISKFSLDDCKKIYNEMLPILVHNKLLSERHSNNIRKKYISNKKISLNLNNGEIIEI